jgi:hypothetical protein
MWLAGREATSSAGGAAATTCTGTNAGASLLVGNPPSA